MRTRRLDLAQSRHFFAGQPAKRTSAPATATNACDGVVVGEKVAGGITGGIEPVNGIALGIQNLQVGVNAQPVESDQNAGASMGGAERGLDNRGEVFTIFAVILIYAFVIQLVVALDGGNKAVWTLVCLFDM